MKNLSRSEKIILFLFEFGTKKVRYEDIVVGLFKKYPHDFHLKGYPEFPDSGDLVHKPLYDFKKKGYVNALSKVFSLTERGVEFAKQLTSGSDTTTKTLNDRLSRSTESEVSRIKSLEGFILFAKAEHDKLSENDFYNYLGVTVRTQKNAFIGRMETMKDVIEELKKNNSNELFKVIAEYHALLISKNSNVIDYFTTQ
jgi:hypothetical protein